MASKEIYNINEMRKALIESRSKGNKGAINKKLCEDLGITNGYFTLYTNLVEKLFNATCKYIDVKHSVKAAEEQKTAQRNELYPLWKELLSSGEKEKTSKELRCSEADIDSIVGYAEMFLNDKNNVDNVKDFVSYKQIAHVQLSRFRKDIETLLGIRIAQVEVMTDAERDRLASQRKLMNKRRKTLEKIDEVVVQNDTLKGLLAKAKEKSVIDDIKKQIKDNEEIIAGQKKKADEITAEIKGLEAKPEEKAKDAGKAQEKKAKKVVEKKPEETKLEADKEAA